MTDERHAAVAELSLRKGWIRWQYIDKGWSSDAKYRIVDKYGTELLLRVSDAQQLERRKSDFELLKKTSEMNIRTPLPLELGTCCQGKSVYLLLSWIPGGDLEDKLPKLDDTEQYRLGKQAGVALSRIHSLRMDDGGMGWEKRYTAKLERVIGRYRECPRKLPYGERVIGFIESNRSGLRGRPMTYQHGDYHIGNFLMTNDRNLAVIDFNRSSVGDPWEEYDRFVFTWKKSAPFANGQIDGYWPDGPPNGFHVLVALYSATNMLASIPWAIPFGEEEVEAMLQNCELVYEAYCGFDSVVPKWFEIGRRKIEESTA